MKFLVAFLGIISIVGVLSNDQLDFPKRPPVSLIRECAERHNIDQVMFDGITANKSFSATINAQCFASCLLDQSGILTPDGENRAKFFINSRFGQECNIWSGENKCEIAANLMNCFFEKDFMVIERNIVLQIDYL